jgi:internalin A
LFGIDYVGQVTVVWLTASPSVTDATMIQVGRLTGLQQLRLDQSSVKDAWLDHLSGLKALSSLNLGDTRFSDLGLARLRPLTRLSAL